MGMMCSVCGVGVDSSGVVWHQYGCNAVERELPLVASSPDPRDAEIAALKAEVASTRDAWAEKFNAQAALVDRLTRALAAGPAALRVSQCNDRMDHDTQQISRVLDDIMQRAAVVVEVAQEAAMKEGT